jgi:hypothetical protein
MDTGDSCYSTLSNYGEIAAGSDAILAASDPAYFAIAATALLEMDYNIQKRRIYSFLMASRNTNMCFERFNQHSLPSSAAMRITSAQLRQVHQVSAIAPCYLARRLIGKIDQHTLDPQVRFERLTSQILAHA